MNPLTAHAAGNCVSSRGGWTRKKFYLLIAAALALHVAFIFLFGTKKQFVPRAVTRVPHIEFANQSDELLELDNPALFALPNPRSFATAVWQKLPEVSVPTFSPTIINCELQAPQNLGASFQQFIRTNRVQDLALSFRPPAVLANPVSPIETTLPENSTFKIIGPLAKRPLLSSPALPSLPFPDVLAPSKVQIVVDRSGNVASAVLLTPDNTLEAAGRPDKGDTNALLYVTKLKFTPAAHLLLGQVIFHWHTTPLTDTNTP